MEGSLSQKSKERERSTGGFVALVSVLIVSAIVLVISIGVSLRSVGETRMSLAAELSSKALGLANACAEYALVQLKGDMGYSGDEILTVEGSNSCSILPVESDGSGGRVIKTQSTVSGYTRKVRVSVEQVDSVLQVAAWEEVPDF